MLQNSIYSVISPEGCASILWRSADYAKDAATALKLTADDMLENGLIDAIINEPQGGAHRNKEQTIKNVAKQIETGLEELSPWKAEKLVHAREEKFLKMGRAA